MISRLKLRQAFCCLRIGLLHVFAPILLGGMIYLFFRQDSLRMFRWVRAIGAEPVLTGIRSNLQDYMLPDAQWFFYSLPDGLWVYSFTAFLLLTWKRQLSLQSLLWLALPISLAVGGEIGQAFGVVPGTYDAVDIILCFAGAVLPVVLLTPRQRIGAQTSGEIR